MTIRKVCHLLAEKLLLKNHTCSLQMLPKVTRSGTASAPYHIAPASGGKVSPFNKISISDRQGALSACQIFLNDKKEKDKCNCCVFLKEYRYTLGN